MKLSRRLLALLFALSFGNPAAKGRTPIRDNKVVSVGTQPVGMAYVPMSVRAP